MCHFQAFLRTCYLSLYHIVAIFMQGLLFFLISFAYLAPKNRSIISVVVTWTLVMKWNSFHVVTFHFRNLKFELSGLRCSQCSNSRQECEVMGPSYRMRSLNPDSEAVHFDDILDLCQRSPDLETTSSESTTTKRVNETSGEAKALFRQLADLLGTWRDPDTILFSIILQTLEIFNQ